jgi:hypothetical protein
MIRLFHSATFLIIPVLRISAQAFTLMLHFDNLSTGLCLSMTALFVIFSFSVSPIFIIQYDILRTKNGFGVRMTIESKLTLALQPFYYCIKADLKKYNSNTGITIIANLKKHCQL